MSVRGLIIGLAAGIVGSWLLFDWLEGRAVVDAADPPPVAAMLPGEMSELRSMLQAGDFQGLDARVASQRKALTRTQSSELAVAGLSDAFRYGTPALAGHFRRWLAAAPNSGFARLAYADFLMHLAAQRQTPAKTSVQRAVDPKVGQWQREALRLLAEAARVDPGLAEASAVLALDLAPHSPAAGILPAGQPGSQTLQLLIQAQQAEAALDASLAVLRYVEAARALSQPEPVVLLRRARFYEYLGWTPDALRDYQSVLRSWPDHPEALMGAARIVSLDDREGSRAEYVSRLLSSDPDHLDALVLALRSRAAAGDTRLADENVAHLLQLDGWEARLDIVLTVASFLADRPVRLNDAATIVDEALPIWPLSGRLQVMRAVVWCRIHQCFEQPAVESLLQACEQTPRCDQIAAEPVRLWLVDQDRAAQEPSQEIRGLLDALMSS